MVLYHFKKKKFFEIAYEDIGDNTPSKIWCGPMIKFGQEIDTYFQKLATTTNHIYIGLEECSTYVVQLHMCINIIAHRDAMDMECPIITFFTIGHLFRGEFDLHQMLYKY
jgi:hypothetical protein